MEERLTIDRRLELLKEESPELYKEATDYMNTIPLLRWMSSDTRPRAKDRKRDEDGKINVIITKPHLLEDTDYFCQAAIAYKATGKYTDYYPSKVPSSPYKQFWDEEIRRCKYGYIRESDGEWVTGYHYFYLNYSPILRTKVIGEVNEDGTIQAERIEDFPDFWDGDYLFYHYIDQAEKAGKYAAVLKARGKGYSFKAASALMRNYFLYKKSKSYAMASDSEYLLSDGVLSKTWDIFSFGVKHVGFSKKLTLKDTAMEKISGYKKPGVAGDHGFLSSIHGVTLKNDPDKARGKRGKLILWEEAGCHIRGTKVIMYDGTYKNVEDVVVGDMLMGPDSIPRKVLELHTGTDDMYRIKPKNGVEQIVNSKHLIYTQYQDYYSKKTKNITITAKEYLNAVEKHPKRKYHYSLLRPEIIEFTKQDVKLSPYVLGLWLGDGESDRASFSSIDVEIINYLKRFTLNNTLGIKINDIKGTECKRINFRGDGESSWNWVKEELKELGILNNKDIPNRYIYTDEESRLQLLAGLIDADGSYNKDKKCVEFTQHEKRKHIIDKAAYIARSLGMRISVSKRLSVERLLKGKIIKGGEIQWKLSILNGHEKIPCLIPRKQSTNRKGFLRSELSTRFDISYYGVDTYYGFTLDKDHLFLTEDFTITHNSFPNILKSWRIAQKSLEDGQLVFGLMVAFGTGGEEGVDFAGLYELFYHPKVYQVYSLRNVWDRNSRGDCAFFVPDYWNRARTYDKDGNSDVLNAIVEVLRKRQTIRKESTNATDIARVKAEEPITPQEAVMRTTGTVFPVSDISEYLQDIEPNLEYFVQEHYVGDLNWTVGQQVAFRPRFDIVPIRDFPYNERHTEGAIELFELPHVAPTDKIPVRGRYIGGADTVDDDTGTSLFSVEIFDLFLDKPVAEYTGRMQRADQNFEIALKLAVFYNAEINYENKLKGMFAYFERHNALRYLADTPPILKDMEYIKQTHLIGNKSKGSPPTPTINAWGRRLQADWMMTKDTNGNLNLHKLRSVAYLKECLQWNPDGNFDRISRSNMTHILRASRLKNIEGVKENSTNTINPIDEDPFFKRNPYRGPGGMSVGMFDSNPDFL